MTKLAQLIAQEEGFYKSGSLPQRNNNPGDLRHSPHSTHTGNPNSIGQIDTLNHGWEDLERQLHLYAQRGMTLRDLAYTYAPPEDNNNTVGYLQFLCNGLSLTESALVIDALEIEA